MIGKAYVSLTPFYDRVKGCMSFKKRPVPIIGQADSADYVVLPISRVTNRRYLSKDYDYTITDADCPLLNLTATSYIRCHKQFTVSLNALTTMIVDFKSIYPKEYQDVIDLVEEFQKKIIYDAR